MRKIRIALVIHAMLLTATLCAAQSGSSYLAHLSRELMLRQLFEMSTRARLYYNTPLENGGGGQSFNGLTLSKLIATPENATGMYCIATVSANDITLVGTGREIGADGSYVAVALTVFPDSLYIVFAN